MLAQPQVQRFAFESGLKDMIAEKEIVLAFLLQLFSERGVLAKLAFKGGTCLRKMHLGSQGRFSTDLDSTGTEDHDHGAVILEMMDAFEEPYHGLKFTVPDDGYYESDDKLSWGVNPTLLARLEQKRRE
jgi:predicted nucleotidyltransferase component of viral defense system